ncbi:hypothetical protein T07_13187 [Trichinella nelsoni]|uniref:Uncharacterized protein n=1 Tax=Trichinella nelsoni TaxID=6336 RepID=A0A0V0RSQ2_9BILA|nr:hypothetical protein T07_13187 [Trichinella nelsoni]
MRIVQASDVACIRLVISAWYQFCHSKTGLRWVDRKSGGNNGHTKNKPDKQTTRPSPIFVPTTIKTFSLPGLERFFYLVRAHSTSGHFFLHRSGRPGKVGEQIAQAKVQKNKQQQQQWTTIEHIGCRRVAIIRIAQADFLQGGSAERVQIIQMTLSFVQTHFLGFGLDVVTAER